MCSLMSGSGVKFAKWCCLPNSLHASGPFPRSAFVQLSSKKMCLENQSELFENKQMSYCQSS